MRTVLLAFAALAPCAAARQQPQPPSACELLLQRVHAAVLDYRALLDEDPKGLADLFDLTGLRPVDLCLPDSARARLAVERPEWARPHVRWTWSEVWKEDMAECLDLEHEQLYTLFGDGRVEARPGGVELWYGDSKGGGTHRLAFDDAALARPSAHLGLGLVAGPLPTVLGRERAAVLVEGILPGYLRTGLDDDFDLRPGDRLLEVDGFEVDSLERLDEFLAGEAPRRRELLVRRPYVGLLHRVSLRPIWDDLLDAEPADVARRARLWLDGQGPGRLDCGLGDGAGGRAAITAVYEGTPAFDAGLRAGDLLLDVEGRAVHSLDVRARLRTLPAGARARLGIERDGARREVEVVLDPVDADELARTRMRIHLGQLDLEGGHRVADRVSPRDVVVLIEAWFGNSAAPRDWLSKAIAEPSEQQRLQLAELYELRADCSARLGEHEAALADLDRAMEEIGFRASWVLWRRAALLEEAGRLEEALEQHRELVALPAGLPPGEDELNLAELLARMGRVEEARTLCEPWVRHLHVGERARALLGGT